jgi:hypothetical protein
MKQWIFIIGGEKLFNQLREFVFYICRNQTCDGMSDFF